MLRQLLFNKYFFNYSSEKYHKKSWGYQIDTKDGASESVWDYDEVEIKPLQDGSLFPDLVFHTPSIFS